MFYKKALSILMALMLLINIAPIVSATDSDSSVYCGDNVTWLFNESTGTLTISGTGPMYDFSKDTIGPWKEYETSIKSVVIEYGVTSIGTCAFFKCENLMSVKIPSSVTSIGIGALSSCVGLLSLNIPSSVTSIGNYAFFSCYKLASVTYTGTTEPTYGSGVFGSCRMLKPVNVPRNYKNNTFCGIPIRRAPTKKISKPNLYRYAITL